MVVIFLPFPDIDRSLRSLDKRRLGKQRVEARQIINALETNSKGWRNHPATRMWEGHLGVLKAYYNHSLKVWAELGGMNLKLTPVLISDEDIAPGYPRWWGWEPVHASHRASLIRKDKIAYDFLQDVTDSFYIQRGYVWPHKHIISPTITDDLFEPINPRQLLPKCEKEGCSFAAKQNGLCGIHRKRCQAVQQ